MQSKELAGGTRKTYVVVFEDGEEAIAGLERFAAEHDLTAAEFTGLGAFSSAVLGFFNTDERDYERIPVDEQVEVLTLVGNVTKHDENTKVHPHVVLGRRDGTACGGHLLEATVRPTLEIIVTEAPENISRRVDPKTGLPLIDLDADPRLRAHPGNAHPRIEP